MDAKYQTSVLLMLAFCGVLAGCNENSAVASPNCADVEKITDPAQKAELLKKCPRSGPEFKPSPAKQW